MAYYNVNKIIRLMRLALEMTKEELCDGICSVMTLSRIESGGAVKKDTCKLLMERLGRTGRINRDYYAVCVSRDGGMLEEQAEMERAFYCQDYKRARQCLSKIKASADGNILTAQYLARAEALADHCQKRIGPAELLDRLGKALRLTVPEYERYISHDKVFPFVKEELLIMINLGTAYLMAGDIDSSLRAYETVVKCLEAGYIGPPDSLRLMIKVKFNMIQVYKLFGKYEEVLAEIDACLRLAAGTEHGHMFAKLLVSKADNYIEWAEKDRMKERCLKEAEKCLRQAYYIASARADRALMDVIKGYYVGHFGGWD